MQSFRQTGSCLPKSCGQVVKRDAKSVSRISYQRQRTSATAQTVPPSKGERKPPSASAGNGQHFPNRVSGRSPDELLFCNGRSKNSLLAPIGRKFKKGIFCCLERMKTKCLCHAFWSRKAAEIKAFLKRKCHKEYRNTRTYKITVYNRDKKKVSF